MKLYALIIIFKHIKKSHGQDIIRTTRKLENLTIKQSKMQLDIKFIKTYKKEQLIITFAKVNIVRYKT